MFYVLNILDAHRLAYETRQGCSLSRAKSLTKYFLVTYKMLSWQMVGNGTRLYNLNETNTANVV